MLVKKNKIETVDTNKELLIKEKAIETSLSGIVISDMEGKFTYVNKSFVEMFGFTNKEEAFKITPLDIHPESEHKVVIDSLNTIKTIGSWKGELLAKKKNGELFNVQISTGLVKDELGNSICMMASFDDITQRKTTLLELKESEEKFRNKNEKLKLMYEELQTTNEMLEEANKEKEVLIKEIHHRVKNNLQTVQSILNMQKYYTDNESTMDLLDECINRIRSMSSIHQSLYETGNLAKIDMLEYIQELISHLHFSYAKDNCVIRFYNEIDKIYLNIEKAIPLGLILNEIITNCLKHAFKDRKFGKISIMLKNKNKKFELRVKDDGIGLPDNINVSADINENYKTYGMSLISIFSNQLKAGIDIMRNNGTEFVLKFSF